MTAAEFRQPQIYLPATSHQLLLMTVLDWLSLVVNCCEFAMIAVTSGRVNNELMSKSIMEHHVRCTGCNSRSDDARY
jgi:hypothetical protein